MSPTITREKLFSVGYLFPVKYGIQIDLNVVRRSMPGGIQQDASLCDHNCTEYVGGYTCNAAFTLNQGVKPNYASGETLLSRIERAREGLALANEVLLSQHLGRYFDAFRIPPDVQGILAESLRSGLCEVNLFGGNPEMHPDVIWLIRELKKRGFRVNLTTTGRRFMVKPDFVESFIADSAHLLALSADDFDPERLERLFEISLEDLRDVWKKISPLHGQAQKFVEGIYAARLVQEKRVGTTVLFNMVLHKGNIRHIYRIMDAIGKYLPNALVNPYPAQDSFDGGKGHLFSAEDVGVFDYLVDFFIAETLNGNPNLTKRLQYWLVMKAVLENCREDPVTASEFIAGHGIWQCYRDDVASIAGMYMQIGKGDSALVQIGGSEDGSPGGYAGCYWNSHTVTAPHQVRSAEQIAKHLLGGMQELAMRSSSPCPGCSMPRLWFDMIRTESGLNPGLRETYLQLRERYVGF